MTEESQTHWKKLTNPNYLGSYAFEKGEEKVRDIVSVQKESVMDANGKAGECTVMTLKDEKPMILNKTNCKILTKLFATPYIENWRGKSIIIYVDPKVKAFGEIVEGLRIKMEKPPLPFLDPKNPKWAGAVQAIAKGTHKIEDVKLRFQLTAENEKLMLTQSEIK